MNAGTESRGHPAIGLSVLGFVILTIGASLLWMSVRKPDAQTAVDAYEYTVSQNAKTTVRYKDNEFFGTAPAASNDAFVAALTDTIVADFTYDYTATRSTDLTTTYDIKAQIKANYAVKGNAEDLSSVWTRDYQLVKPVTSRTQGNKISLSRTVDIPYTDYMQTVDQFRTALSLPTNSEVVVNFTIHTTGKIDDVPFSDTRTSTISAPLDQQIYIPSIKFDKSDTKQIAPATVNTSENRWTKNGTYIGVALAVVGLSMLIYGTRKRIFKSAYQRDLDKIYRYHDGIIVRTSRPVDLTEHQVVPMRSFDDMLNLEEELKTPIIADEISSTLTHFIIAHHNVTYLYKLGDGDDHTNHNQAIAARTTSQALTAAQHPRAAREVLAPISAKHQPLSGQSSTAAWSDIIDELDRKPTTRPTHHKKKIQ